MSAADDGAVTPGDIAGGGHAGFIAGGGRVGALIRAKDWSATPLGPVDEWPQSLRTSVGTCLDCSFPILIWWGPGLVMIYNDAYADIIVDKHPHALGAPGHTVWPEIWDTVGPMLDQVMAHGVATPAEDMRLVLERRGFPEECYFTFSYSPIRDESGAVGGVFCPVVETTARVLGERRTAFLLDLERTLRDASGTRPATEAACRLWGTFLGTVRAGYADADEDGLTLRIAGDWHEPGLPPIAVSSDLAEYGPAIADSLRQGRTVLVHDTLADHRTAADGVAERLAGRGTRAFVAVPLIKAGGLLAVLFASSASPRRWTAAEGALALDVAERLWSAVERTRAEQALRHSEEEFRALGEHMPNLCWMARADGWIYWFNRGWHDYTGTTLEQTQGWGWHTVHDPAVLPSVLRHWTDCIEAGVLFEMTFPLRGADGVLRPFLTRISPVRDRDGTVVRWFGSNVDISAQQEVERALRDSEARLRIAQSAGGIGTFEWFPEQGLVHVSEEYRRIWGLPHAGLLKDSDLIGMIDEQDRGLSGPARLHGPGNPVRYAEYRITRPDSGEHRWVARRGELVSGPAPGGEAMVARYVGVTFDVTDRHAIEAALQDSEILFRATFEQAAVGIAHVGLDGRLLRVNDRLCRILGYTEAELQGTDFKDLTRPGDLEDDDRVDALLDGRAEFYRTEKRCLRRTGEPFWVTLTVSLLRDTEGAPRHFVSVVEDISDRKAAEAALASSQARLQAIFDTVPVSIVFAEAPSGRLVFGNAAVNRVFRHPMRYSDDVAGYAEWEAYDAEDRRIDPAAFPLAVALRTGAPAAAEFRFLCGDGVRRWIAASSAPLRDEVGVVTGAVVVCSDIDELRKAQALLSRDKHELERLVAERTHELQTTQTRLAHAQRMEALGQLAGGIAHDFNNIIQAVQGAARLIERRADDRNGCAAWPPWPLNRPVAAPASPDACSPSPDAATSGRSRSTRQRCWAGCTKFWRTRWVPTSTCDGTRHRACRAYRRTRASSRRCSSTWRPTPATRSRARARCACRLRSTSIRSMAAPGRWCASRWRTPAAGWRRTCWPAPPNRSSRPRGWARGRGSGSRWRAALPSRAAGRCGSSAHRGKARR